jgi:hypothetical protein
VADQELERSSRRFATTTAVLGGLLLAVLAWEWSEVFREPSSAERGFLLVQALYWSPAPFYLWALWALRRTFRDVAAGAAFTPAVARALRRLGLANVVGGSLGLFMVPILKLARRGAHVAAMERLASIDFDDVLMWTYLMLIFMGITLLLLSRLMTRAVAFRARNEALERELEGFF